MIACLLPVVFHQQTLRPCPLFSDGMVLQRDRPDPVYGTALPRQVVTATMDGQQVTTKADDDGRWTLNLPPKSPGGPYVATIAAGDASVTIKNVMVGEVWVCSGQSNMERPEAMANDYAQAEEEADPSIRMFTVAKNSMETPASLVRGVWVPASKSNVGAFSAVGLAFGTVIHKRLGEAVGLINASWGGTRAEAWTSRDALQANAALRPDLDAYLASIRDFETKRAEYRSQLRTWIASKLDRENAGYLQGWAQPLVFEKDWKAETLPGTMDGMEPSEEGQGFDGAVWFRRTFDLPEAWEGKALKLELGPISDYDDTYVNGSKVGFTKAEASDPSLAARTYRISPGIPVHGVNTIAIRVFAAQGVCGFTGLPDQMRVSPMDGDPTAAISLAGPWLEKIERKMDAGDPPPHMPLGPGSPEAPGGLFNGMIAPLTHCAIKGVIWYQGESDAGNAAKYKLLFPALIRDWRQKWGQTELPFYFVQLANYKQRLDQPSDSDWAELRQAQAGALKLAHTGMATAIDIGDAATIHPTNKREVGRRLALIALSKDYGLHETWSGPEFHNMIASGGSFRVFFNHADDGLKTPDGKPPRGFAVAGEDRRFHWASAVIQGTAVVVSCPAVPDPIAVRYAWADNPDCTLYNAEGLPAVPFRTDHWPRVDIAAAPQATRRTGG